jgi:chromosome segregation ATPase
MIIKREKRMKRVVELGHVVKAYTKLKDQGDQITVKNIIDITGGSTTTVSPLLRRYQEQLENEKSMSYPISAELRNAYITAIHDAVTTARQDSEEDLAELRTNEKNLISELNQTESRKKVLTDQLTTIEQQLTDSEQQSRIDTAKLNQQLSDLEQQLQHIQNDKDLLQETIDVGKTKIVQMEINLQLAQERNKQTEQRSDELQMQNDELRKQIANLDKQLAVTEERLNSARSNEQYKETIKDLKEEVLILRNNNEPKHNQNASQ